MFKDPTMVDSNGQKYIVGYDKYGYFSIKGAEIVPEELVGEDTKTVMFEGEEVPYELVDNVPVNLEPAAVETVKELL